MFKYDSKTGQVLTDTPVEMAEFLKSYVGIAPPRAGAVTDESEPEPKRKYARRKAPASRARKPKRGEFKQEQIVRSALSLLTAVRDSGGKLIGKAEGITPSGVVAPREIGQMVVAIDAYLNAHFGEPLETYARYVKTHKGIGYRAETDLGSIIGKLQEQIPQGHLNGKSAASKNFVMTP